MKHRVRCIVGLLAVGLATLPAIAPTAAYGPGGHDPAPMLVRKNVLELSASERQEFVAAVLALKQTPSPYDSRLSYYDQFVAWHVTLYRCAAAGHDVHGGHNGPFFLPWHH